ncbi:Uncharacterised protein [Bordetella pertussis]|nr:Uncharacterised protein [Bordetella pertussis]CPK68213.1 Uncharacterised protein [Bordetella pertussis]
MSRTPIQACQASAKKASEARIWPTGRANTWKVNRAFQFSYVKAGMISRPTISTRVYTARMTAVMRWAMKSVTP